MLRLVAGLARILPLMIALAALALIIYLVISWLRSPMRAKQIMIKVFLWLCAAITVFFLIASLYAAIDGNVAVLELAASCAFVGVLGLAITLVCRYRFRKHHPNYSFEAEKVTIEGNKPDVGSIAAKILQILMRRGR